jgi:predicted DsbA family dithiol-disulfide isomerase
VINFKSKVVVYSDYICPFCLIGKQRVERLEKELDVATEWRGFEIHPETPEEGSTFEDMGIDEGYIETVKASVEKLAEDAGIKIKFPTIISNSRLALEISEFAKEKGGFKEFHTAVFKAYWQEGVDIGDREFLFGVAKKAGLNIQELKKYLDSGRGRAKLIQYLAEVREHGITGVPTFIIGGKMLVGAHPYEMLKKMVNDSTGRGG